MNTITLIMKNRMNLEKLCSDRLMPIERTHEKWPQIEEKNLVLLSRIMSYTISGFS